MSVAVIWIDWYHYHVARFRALSTHAGLQGRVTGVELVGGAGVHGAAGFRDESRQGLSISTLVPGQGWKQTSQWKLALETWRKLNELNPATVLVPGYYTLPALAAAVWSKLRGRRAVLMTESTEADHQRTPWKEMLKGALMRSLFDWAIAGGEAHVRYLERLRFSPDRIARRYDVVDNAYFRSMAQQFRSRVEDRPASLPQKYFLYVGRLAEEKNIAGLLQAFSTYRNAGGDWSLVLVGDGPERARLETLTAKLELTGSVQFAGFRGTQDIVPFYAFAGCFVLPSTREPWGLVVNEAMACGLPIIVSNRCGCAEDLLREGANGLSFNPDTPDDLARCLKQMARLPEAERLAWGGRSLERIAQYSPESWANEVARVVAA